MPNPLSWLWDQAKRAYRKVTGGGSISDRTLTGIRNDYGTQKADWVSGQASDLLNGNKTLNQWTLDFRQELKNIYINQYAMARGGYNAMTQQDWGSIGGQLKRQYEYMQNFADKIASGDLSAAQIEQRMQYYFKSATQAFERGKAAAAGIFGQLPQYPGDGRTRCRTNCKCEWVIEETEDAFLCTWKLNPAEHCIDCLENARKWSPLVVPKVTF
jgi:hypothetical protein